MKKQIQSFANAFKGVWNTIKSEAHMRFHMVAAFYVILFSSFYDLSEGQRVLLLVMIAFVLVLEILNTCIEQLCDMYTDRYEPRVKFIKDAAAGAVLVAAIAAAISAVILFLKPSVIIRIVSFFAINPVLLVLLALSAVLSVIFVWLGPVGIKNLFKKNICKK